MTPLMAPKASRSDRDWTTSDEIAFLEHLGTGTYSDSGALRGVSRATLLRRYLASCSWRTDWSTINQKRVRTAAQRMLKECPQDPVAPGACR